MFALACAYAAFLGYTRYAKPFAVQPPTADKKPVAAQKEEAPPSEEASEPIESSIHAWKRGLNLAQEGAVLAEMGKTEQALAKLRESVDVAPDLTRSRAELARLHERERNFAEAEREWRAVLARDPENLTARIRLAVVFLAAGRYEAALATAQWALEADPYAQEALDVAASALAGLRRHREALDYLRRLAAIDRENAAVKIRMGLSFAALGDLKNAEASFYDVLRSDPANSVAAYNLAVICARRGDAAGAVDLLREAAQRHGSPFVLAWTRSADFDPIRNDPAFEAFANAPAQEPESNPSSATTTP
ncbi:MAG: tetratricopeptide repeat protein [Kiritimatiellae bacterium]|nr:tetratricopeptide repeat protein [Kiritimatiellia bacterium]MDW8458286.1 tetratricopeptide repeat protein [Verrucomicrobiota bacterium]